MISKLVRFSIRYRWLIFLFTTLVAVAGWFSFQTLPIDAVPDITNTQVQVNTQVEALGAEEIERTVTLPIETSLNGIPGVVQVRSLSRFGLSQVTVVFEDGTDIYRARQLVSERLQGTMGQLPKNAESLLGPVTSGLGEIYHYVLESETVAEGSARIDQLTELRALQDWYLRPRLLSVKGVAEINAIGGYERQYVIQPNPRKLKAFGLHFSDLQESLEKSNQNVGGAYVEQTGDQFLVQGHGLFKALPDIENVPLRTLENGSPISVGDVAKVSMGHSLRTGAALHSGKEAVVGTVLMLLGENSRTVALRVDDKIDKIRKSLPKGYKIETVYDRSDLVGETLGTIQHNLIVGAFLVTLVLFLLIGNLRAAVITALVIPLSLLFTFILMRRFGLSGNLVSLGALDFGIIVDGAVIVLDNCVRHIHEKSRHLHRRLTKTELEETVHDATVEIRKSAGFGELILLVVFLPVFALTGIEGKMFIPMAATFIFAIVGAVLLSFTFVPALASLILKGHVEDREPWIMRRITQIYEPALKLSLRARKAVMGGAFAFVVLGTFFFARLGGEFLPQLNEGSIAIQFIRPVSVGLSHSILLEEKSQELIRSYPEVATVFSRIGTSEISLDPMGPNISDAFVMLKPRSEWPLVHGERRTKEDLVEALVADLEAKTPGQRILVSQPIQLRFNELMEGTRADVSLKIFGEDQQSLSITAQRIVEVLKRIPGAGDVELETSGTIPVLNVVPDKAILKRLGVGSREVLEAVEIGIGGKEVGTFYEGVRRFPIVVRLGDTERSDLEKIKALPIAVAGATMVPLSQVAKISFSEANSAFNREQTRRRAAVLINPRGIDTQSFVTQAQQLIQSEIQLPPGSYLEWGGNFKNLEQAKSRLKILAPLALLLIVLMIYAAFRNVLETVLIFLCIPLALVGGVFALMLKGLPFSVSAGIGFIALSGIAVLNGVVLVSYFNDLRKTGLRGEDLVRVGSRLRLRPVLMTALVDVFGFLPMAFASGMGAEIQEPLATVVIGGILTSTALTLILLPVLYAHYEQQILRNGR